MNNRGKILVIFFRDIAAAEKKLREVRQSEAEAGILTENILYGDEVEKASEILSLCRTPPFFGGYRLIIVRRAEKIPAPIARELYPGLKKPPGCAYLVFMRQEEKKGDLPFPHKWSHYPLKGEEREKEDSFGLVKALEKRDVEKAFRVLEYQFRSEHQDFPRFFGLLCWFLRSRVERRIWPASPGTAFLFERFHRFEIEVRTGRLAARTALEMAILALVDHGANKPSGRKGKT